MGEPSSWANGMAKEAYIIITSIITEKCSDETLLVECLYWACAIESIRV